MPKIMLDGGLNQKYIGNQEKDRPQTNLADLDVMRRSRVIAFVFLAVLFIGALWCGLTWKISGADANNNFSPRVTLTVLRYETTNVITYTETLRTNQWSDAHTPYLWFTTFAPETTNQVQTNSSALVAHVRLRNTGTHSIFYYDFGGVPVDLCRVQREGTWADWFIMHFNSRYAALKAGEELSFSVWLPPDESAWQFLFDCERPGPRERMRNDGFGKWLPTKLLNALPRGWTAHAVLQSDVLTVGTNAVTGQPQQLRNL